MGEFAFGRWAQKGPMGSFDKVLRQKGHSFGRWLGAYPVLMMLGAVVFYAIVTGWILHGISAQYGGAAFMVPYLLFVYVLGTTGLFTALCLTSGNPEAQRHGGFRPAGRNWPEIRGVAGKISVTSGIVCPLPGEVTLFQVKCSYTPDQ